MSKSVVVVGAMASAMVLASMAVVRTASPGGGKPRTVTKDMNVLIEDGNIKGYKVNVEITFMLEE